MRHDIGDVPLVAAVAPAGQAAVAQRSVWTYDGTAWAKTSDKLSEYDEGHPEPEVREGGKKGDRYEQHTGTYYSADQWYRARLARIKKRQQDRTGDFRRGQDRSKKSYDGISKKKGGRDKYDTPFGKAHVGRGAWTLQPYVGLEKDEWPDKEAALPQTNYDTLSTTLDSVADKDTMIDDMSGFLGGKATDPVTSSSVTLSQYEKQAATILSGLMTLAEPHETRNPYGGKLERGALNLAKQKGFNHVFNRKDGAYTPAWAIAGGAKQGGTSAMQDMHSGKRAFLPQTRELFEELSESSADETPERKPKKKKRTRSNSDSENSDGSDSEGGRKKRKTEDEVSDAENGGTSD